ncbi:hypothetical protein HUU40_00915 [candidate division KSB1 bacterium]|nr:hypothetical protein [candidate division KSB1 bacterium]
MKTGIKSGWKGMIIKQSFCFAAFDMCASEKDQSPALSWPERFSMGVQFPKVGAVNMSPSQGFNLFFLAIFLQSFHPFGILGSENPEGMTGL